MTDTRYHSIGLRWTNPAVSGLHDLVVDLTADEQASVQPHIDAIVNFWRVRAQAAAERERVVGRADPLGIG